MDMFSRHEVKSCRTLNFPFCTFAVLVSPVSALVLLMVKISYFGPCLKFNFKLNFENLGKHANMQNLKMKNNTLLYT